MVAIRPFGLLVFTTVALAALSGCASSPNGAPLSRPSVNYVPGVAVLDPKTATVTEPLDAYDADASAQLELDRAADLLMQECAAEKGVDLAYPNVFDYPPSTFYQLTYFGPWTEDRASRTGFDFPEDKLSLARTVFYSSMSPEVSDVIDDCARNELTDPVTIDVSGESSIVRRGKTESWDWASGDPVWAAAMDAYATCMTDAGYTFDESRSPYVPTIQGEPSSAEGITAALREVSCMNSVGAPQIFSDVAAAYQTVFIADNEAALVAEKAAIDEKIETARQIIARNA
ncbi:hypothetical protein HQQ80_04085 [Microbacteriaceae bacterium VKM Ac-2855]|nr:hypothetical protein [Microbacteriaceae bacterium VKM Ac-2855]